jgi:hypothetical protein
LAQSRKWVELEDIAIDFVDNAEMLIESIKKDETGALIQFNPDSRYDSIFEIFAQNRCEELASFRRKSLYVEISLEGELEKVLLEQIGDLKRLSKKMGKPLDPQKFGITDICRLTETAPALSRKVRAVIIDSDKTRANHIAFVVRLFRNGDAKIIIPASKDSIIEIPPNSDILFVSNDLTPAINGSKIVDDLGSAWQGIAMSMGDEKNSANMELHFPCMSKIGKNKRVTESFIQVLLHLFETLDAVDHKTKCIKPIRKSAF